MSKKYKKNKSESESSEESESYSESENESNDESEYESPTPPRKHKSKKSKRSEKSELDTEVNEEDQVEDDTEPISQSEIIQLNKQIRAKLKKKILGWLDDDDKIKELNANIKQIKDKKKAQEAGIIDMMTKLGMGDRKIDVHDDDSQLKGRVYRQKSVTKGAIKEDIIKDALMETIRDEKKVNQLVKKIENKRPINERYYLKRTKGNKD